MKRTPVVTLCLFCWLVACTRSAEPPERDPQQAGIEASPGAIPNGGVDRESARLLARRVEGVRSVAWIDQKNLFIIVSTNDARSYRTIDAICLQLESLGDIAGIVVQLQSGAATNAQELEILSRNCRRAGDDRAFLQPKRKIDAIPNEIRAGHLPNIHDVNVNELTGTGSPRAVPMFGMTA